MCRMRCGPPSVRSSSLAGSFVDGAQSVPAVGCAYRRALNSSAHDRICRTEPNRTEPSRAERRYSVEGKLPTQVALAAPPCAMAHAHRLPCAQKCGTRTTSAPGLGSPLPHLRRERAHRPPHLRRDCAGPHVVESAQALPIPPPPDKARRAEGGLAMPTDPTQCPICRSERSNPAANHTGYVFCYPCIFTYVQQHQRCPVTHITSSQDQIRKLYETSS